MSFLYPLIGAFSNSFFRGGLMETVLLKGKNFTYGKPLHAIIYGFCCLFATHEWWMLPAGILSMMIGQAPAWGKYIAAMNGDSDKGFKWGFIKMTLRGLLWGLSLAIPFAFYDLWIALAFLLAGGTQGLIYGGMIKIKGKWHQTPVFNTWSVSEMVHGFILFLPLCFL